MSAEIETPETPEQFAARVAERHGFKSARDPGFIRLMEEIIWPVAVEAMMIALPSLHDDGHLGEAAPINWGERHMLTAREILAHPATADDLRERLLEV